MYDIKSRTSKLGKNIIEFVKKFLKISFQNPLFHNLLNLVQV